MKQILDRYINAQIQDATKIFIESVGYEHGMDLEIDLVV